MGQGMAECDCEWPDECGALGFCQAAKAERLRAEALGLRARSPVSLLRACVWCALGFVLLGTWGWGVWLVVWWFRGLG